MRIPISRVRSATPYAMTPYVPSAASTSASAAKPDSSDVVNRSLDARLAEHVFDRLHVVHGKRAIERRDDAAHAATTPSGAPA